MNLGTIGSPTYSESLGGISDIMNALPDNNTNIIEAKDVRDSFLTIYSEIQDLTNTVTQISSITASNVLYDNDNLTRVTVGGITTGTNLDNKSIKEILDLMLYPYVQPTISFSTNLSLFEFGDTSASTTVTWNIGLGSNTLVSIGITPSNTPISSSQNSGSLVISPLTPNVNNTITLNINDGTLYTRSLTVSPANRRYWGTVTINTTPSSATILGLTGAGVGSGSELSTNRIKNYNNINGNGNHLCFAYPSTFGEPTFIINGLNNNAFTKYTINFVNSFSFSTTYSVYISNTKQNSPISSFQIN